MDVIPTDKFLINLLESFANGMSQNEILTQHHLDLSTVKDHILIKLDKILASEKIGFELISKFLCMPIKDIKIKVLRICSDKISNGENIDNICSQFKIPKDVITEYINQVDDGGASSFAEDIVILKKRLDQIDIKINDLTKMMKTMNLMIATLISEKSKVQTNSVEK